MNRITKLSQTEHQYFNFCSFSYKGKSYRGTGEPSHRAIFLSNGNTYEWKIYLDDTFLFSISTRDAAEKISKKLLLKGLKKTKQ